MGSATLKKNYFQLLLQHMQRYLRFHAHPTIRYHHARRIKIVYSLLQRSSGAALLDVGCGEGLDVFNLANQYPYTIGIDLSIDALNRAMECNPPTNAFFVRGDAEYLPFCSRSISISICLDVLEHLPAPRNALKELKRVSKDLIVIAVPLATNPPFSKLLSKLRWFKTTPFNIETEAERKGMKELPEHGHLHEYSVSKIKKELQELRVQNIKGLILMGQFTLPFREKILSRFPKFVHIFVRLDEIFSRLFPLGRWGAAVIAIHP
ncbi:MAG: class I SAM-dependent methyltransferase [Candidatus Lokiarchaeota archaeon]|nr:class I SAM-dependent methyltransferase [Candidatus Lokiarchaeota archaeon]